MTSPQKTSSDLTMEAWQLGWEASSVIWLRSWRMMAGGKLAETESRRMVSEKVEAAMTFWPAMMTAGFASSPEEFGTRALGHYSKPVKANQRRLSRKR